MSQQARFLITRTNGLRHPALHMSAEVHDSVPVLVAWTGKNVVVVPMHKVADITWTTFNEEGD